MEKTAQDCAGKAPLVGAKTVSPLGRELVIVPAQVTRPLGWDRPRREAPEYEKDH